VSVDGVTRGYACVQDGPTLWISRDGRVWAVREQERLEAERHEVGAPVSGQVVSPMPGTVTRVEVTEGQQVTAGQKLVVVEAMKMEHVLVAPVDGTVSALKTSAGETVAKDAVLLVVEP
jgi:acetyl-CoA/propionyl-CoA carboxylase biotin carboxyl carrier protein